MLPYFDFFTQGERANAVVVKLTIDSSLWTTKFMAKFLREESGKKISDVLLLSEAHSIRESFDDLY